MDKDVFELRTSITGKLKDRLLKEMDGDGFVHRPASLIIKDALTFYFNSKDKPQIISQVKPLQNLQNLSDPDKLEIPVIMNVVKSDEESEIIEGGSIISMRGVDPHAVMLAKRAKRKGLPYDVGLEKYFGDNA